MGQSAIRVGDLCIGTCTSHPIPIPFTAVYVQCSANVMNATGRAIVGSLAISSCGHTFVAIQGAGTVIINGQGAHRLGDQVTGSGSGVAVMGSTNVFVGA